jgi:uncharacterized membrane protein
MDDVLHPLTKRAWPTVEDQRHTYGLATAVVVAMIACATFAAGTAPKTPLILFGAAAVLFARTTNRVWNLPQRRADFDAGTFEFTSPFDLSDSGGTAVDFQDVRRCELRAHTVSRPGRNSRRLAYFVLQVYTTDGSEPFRLESAHYGELHGLVHLGRALAGELEVPFDAGIDLVEPGPVRRDYQSSWWSAPAFRFGLLSLVIVASLVGLVIAGIKGAIPPLSFLVLALVTVAFAAWAFHSAGRYHQPDQIGRHTVSVEEPDHIEVSSLNPFHETFRYRADELEAIAIHDGHDPAILFVEDEQTRILPLRDGDLAREFADDLPGVFGADERDESPAGDRPSEMSSW